MPLDPTSSEQLIAIENSSINFTTSDDLISTENFDRGWSSEWIQGTGFRDNCTDLT